MSIIHNRCSIFVSSFWFFSIEGNVDMLDCWWLSCFNRIVWHKLDVAWFNNSLERFIEEDSVGVEAISVANKGTFDSSWNNFSIFILFHDDDWLSEDLIYLVCHSWIVHSGSCKVFTSRNSVCSIYDCVESFTPQVFLQTWIVEQSSDAIQNCPICSLYATVFFWHVGGWEVVNDSSFGKPAIQIWVSVLSSIFFYDVLHWKLLVAAKL